MFSASTSHSSSPGGLIRHGSASNSLGGSALWTDYVNWQEHGPFATLVFPAMADINASDDHFAGPMFNSNAISMLDDGALHNVLQGRPIFMTVHGDGTARRHCYQAHAQLLATQGGKVRRQRKHRQRRCGNSFRLHLPRSECANRDQQTSHPQQQRTTISRHSEPP